MTNKMANNYKKQKRWFDEYIYFKDAGWFALRVAREIMEETGDGYWLDYVNQAVIRKALKDLRKGPHPPTL